MPSGWSRPHHQTKSNESPWPQPDLIVSQREGSATRQERRRGSVCRCCDLGGGAPLESSCGPRHGLRRTSAAFAYAGTATLPALVVGTAVRVLGPIVESPSHLAIIATTAVFQSGAVRPKPIGNDHLRPAVPHHRFLIEFEGCLAIALFHAASVVLLTAPQEMLSRRNRWPNSIASSHGLLIVNRTYRNLMPVPALDLGLEGGPLQPHGRQRRP